MKLVCWLGQGLLKRKNLVIPGTVHELGIECLLRNHHVHTVLYTVYSTVSSVTVAQYCSANASGQKPLYSTVELIVYTSAQKLLSPVQCTDVALQRRKLVLLYKSRSSKTPLLLTKIQRKETLNFSNRGIY